MLKKILRSESFILIIHVIVRLHTTINNTLSYYPYYETNHKNSQLIATTPRRLR